MKRLPVIAIVIVAAAVAAMVRLGFWQLHRARENEQLLTQYAQAAKLPPISFPTAPLKGAPPFFRWATGVCLKVVGQRETEGRNRAGEIGWAHIVECATGAEGPGMAVDVGWSKNPNARVTWVGGPVSGVIVRDSRHEIRIVADTASAGLQPSALPSPETAVPITPTRNRLYAIQWFAFAGIALVIFLLALRKRLRPE